LRLPRRPAEEGISLALVKVTVATRNAIDSFIGVFGIKVSGCCQRNSCCFLIGSFKKSLP